MSIVLRTETVALVLCAGLGQAAFALAAGEADRLASEQARLELVKERLAAVEKELASLDVRQTSLLGELHRLEIQIRVAREQLELLKLELDQNNRRIDENLRRIGELEESIEALKPYLTSRSVSLYKMGRLSYLRLLLSLEQPGELSRAYRYISRLARADAERMSGFLSHQEELTTSKAELVAQTQKTLATRDQLAAVTRRLEARRKSRQALLDEIAGRREMAETLMAELEDARNDLGALVDRLSRGEGAAEVAPVLVPIRAFRGELEWPVEGTIAARFGKQLHPRFRTVTIQNGIELAAPLGATVQAVYDGQVAFASWFQGYGMLLILRHPRDVYSLYGHLGEIRVEEGAFVREGDPVAVVGDTGSVSGPSLYFEIREGGKPVDPEEWLARRK